MQENKGFIATSLLYAFLLCFLTLFLAYMANYLQNKQLVDQIKLMAQDDLETYKNKYVSDLEIGDVVIFDTVSREGDKNNDNNTRFESLVNDNSTWILFKTEGGGKYTEDGNIKFHDMKLYFVSDISAQKTTAVFFPQVEYDWNGNIKYSDNLKTPNNSSEFQTLTLRNVKNMMFDNIYYNGSTQKYLAKRPENVTQSDTSVYRYSFPYSKTMNVRLLNSSDLSEIISLDTPIANAIIDERHQFVFWNESAFTTSNGMNISEGFTVYYRTGFGFADGVDATKVNNECGNGDDVVSFSSESGEIEFVNDSSANKLHYGHTYIGQSGSYVDYCYKVSQSIGNCPNDWWSSMWGSLTSDPCTQTGGTYPVRLVIELTINASSTTTDGYIDAGNGTPQLPYLITTGVKGDV